MGTWLEQASPSDFEPWEERLAAGEEPSSAARALGRTSSYYRRGDPDRHAEALAMSREARFGRVDEVMEDWAAEEGASPQIRLAWAKRWNGAYRDGVQVELSGPGGGPISLDREVSLVAVLRVLAEAGELDAAYEQARSEQSLPSPAPVRAALPS